MASRVSFACKTDWSFFGASSAFASLLPAAEPLNPSDFNSVRAKWKKFNVVSAIQKFLTFFVKFVFAIFLKKVPKIRFFCFCSLQAKI